MPEMFQICAFPVWVNKNDCKYVVFSVMLKSQIKVEFLILVKKGEYVADARILPFTIFQIFPTLRKKTSLISQLSFL